MCQRLLIVLLSLLSCIFALAQTQISSVAVTDERKTPQNLLVWTKSLLRGMSKPNMVRPRS